MHREVNSPPNQEVGRGQQLEPRGRQQDGVEAEGVEGRAGGRRDVRRKADAAEHLRPDDLPERGRLARRGLSKKLQNANYCDLPSYI